jgi:hypothetical protein
MAHPYWPQRRDAAVPLLRLPRTSDEAFTGAAVLFAIGLILVAAGR